MDRRRSFAGSTFCILCLQFFVAEQVASRAWHVPYSFMRNYVSDLGALRCTENICSPLHGVMNTSFLLQGVLIAGAAILLPAPAPLQASRTFTRALLIASGVGVFVVGLFPQDSFRPAHLAGAGLHFVCGGMAMAVVGWDRAHTGERAVGSVSITLGLAVLVASGSLLSARVITGGYVGLVERVAAYGIPLWMAWTGWRSFRAMQPAGRLRG